MSISSLLEIQDYVPLELNMMGKGGGGEGKGGMEKGEEGVLNTHTTNSFVHLNKMIEII